MKLHRLALAAFLSFTAFTAVADEGMWMIHLLENGLIEKMQKAGLKLPANVLYDESAASISDAVVSLDFGCTGSIISDRGLVITNHHCAYADVHAISTPEEDYLENGFWAFSQQEEYPIRGKSIYFLRKVIDITEELENFRSEEAAAGRGTGSRRISALIEKKYSSETGLEASVSSMWRGEKQYLFLYEVYKDIRLVGAPPVSIAAFGGDIDNWEWPQHKGDFALYRIYTAPDGSPAEYSERNIPLRPKKVLDLSDRGLEEGDFTMVIGFPGRTDRYCSSFSVERKRDLDNPATCRLQGGRLKIMNRWMNVSPVHRLTYADQYFSISNVQELKEGEILTYRRYDVPGIKRAEEEELKAWIAADPERTARWGTLLEDLEQLYALTAHQEEQKICHRESMIRGSQYFLLHARITNILRTAQKKDLQKIDFRTYPALMRNMLGLYREMIPEVESELFRFSFGEFMKQIDRDNRGDFLNSRHLETSVEIEDFADSLLQHSFLRDSAAFLSYASTCHTPAEIHADPLIRLYESSPVHHITDRIRAIEKNYSEKYGRSVYDPRPCPRRGLKGKDRKMGVMKMWGILSLEKEYSIALYQMRKDKGQMQYPDANSTMRITYGKVGGLHPRDGVQCSAFSRTAGILEKEDPAQYEYSLQPGFRTLLEQKEDKGGMTVNFLTDNDITGGNSGSPVLDAEGRIVGLAFDGNKESLCGDAWFHPEYSKCVNVDIRYVLWILEEQIHFDRILREIGRK